MVEKSTYRIENVTCHCKKCNIEYQRPLVFLLYHLETNTEKRPEFFFKRQLEYCDTHRKERELEMLKNLGKVIETLANN